MERVVREARDKAMWRPSSSVVREIPDINSRNFNVRGFAEADSYQLTPIQVCSRHLENCHDHLDQALERSIQDQDASSSAQ